MSNASRAALDIVRFKSHIRKQSRAPKVVIFWCAVGRNGTPDRLVISDTKSEAENKEKARAKFMGQDARPVRAFRLVRLTKQEEREYGV